MKSSIVLAVAAFLSLVAFPTTTVGKNLRFWPKTIEGWQNPSEIPRNEMFMSTAHKFNYGDSKVWKCTYSDGSAPAISISPSIPSTPSTPSTPSPSPPTPKKSPPPPTPSPPPPTPKASPPPPPTPKASPPPPTPKASPPPPTPKASPPPSTPKASPAPPVPTLPPPAPKKSPSQPPKDDQPSNPPPEHHHSHQNPWEHVSSCLRNMGNVRMCRAQMDISYFTRRFSVSDYCCNLIVNMRSECDDVVWGFFTDPYFVPVVRCTCHVSY